MKRSWAVLSIALAVLTGCELSEKQCLQGDWAGIGLRDGSNGRSADHIEDHVEACSKHGVIPDRSAWEQGRQQGLLSYCTPQKAYELGANGRSVRAVCPAEKMSTLQAANDRGQSYYRVSREIRELESERSRLFAQLSKLDPKDTLGSARIQSELSQLDFEIRLLLIERGRFSEFSLG